MKGTVTVGSASTPQPVLDANSATQHQADDAEAQAAADAVSAQVTPNGDGTNTVVARAGLTTQHVRVDEFLPANLTVHPGDKVTWLASASNIHTVTFPAGPAGNVIDPLTPPYSPGECETASGPDGQPTGPPPFGCGPDPSKFEQTLNPNPFGPASILPSGYRLGSADGSVAAFGSPAPLAGASHLAAPIVALVETQDDLGYWQFGADGGVFASGDAPFYGSAVGKITAPVVGGFAAPDGSSYTLVSQDGNTYTLGANTHNGSGLPKLAAPAVGGTTSPGLFGPGGWVAAADGGVFSIGAAPFLGSAGALHLNAPVVGMAATPDGGGYWLVASDGGIFNYGDAPFLGSLGGTHLNAPIVGIAATDSGQGYTLVAADGGVFTFGDAVFSGSAGGTHLSAPVTSIGFVNSTLASSGVLATAPIPYPSSYTFSFRAGGTFTYQCRIHDHMRAVVTVA
jgi:plastocyanin